MSTYDYVFIRYQLNNGKWRLLNSKTEEFTTVDDVYDIKECKFELLAQKDGTKSDTFARIY